MYRNYLMLPESIQRRPLPGHRHHPKKDKKVPETFTPISRAGRRAPGATKVKSAMANNANNAEERTGVDLFKFIKKLNKILAARLTLPGTEPTEFKASPVLMVTSDQDVSGCLPEQLTGMYEPMDTTPDDTQGPIFRFVPQESHMFDSPELAQHFAPRQAQFELGVMLRPPVYQTVQPLEHQHFVDQDQRLRPPMEGFFPVVPHIDIGHAIHQHPNVPIPLQPIIHDEPIYPQLMFYPPAHEEFVNQLHVPPLVNEMAGHDGRITYQHIGEAGGLVHPGNRRFFMNAEVGEPGHVGLFDELFGIGNFDEGENDDDNDDEQVEVVP